MHIPDGFLDTKTWVTTAAASSVAITYAIKKVNEELEEKDPPLMGVLAAFIFAAQMLNFPVAGGTSGHFVGGALAAILLGPWKAILVMFSVVSIQALLFGDGGITALGANILNMAIISPLAAFGTYRLFKHHSLTVGAFTAGLVSTVVAALSCSVELAISGTAPFSIVIPLMTGWHLLIGTGEGLITMTTLSYLARIRPDLIKNHAGLDWQSILVFSGVAAFLALILSPFASSFPDGLEKVAQTLGFIKHETSLFKALIPDYSMPGFGDSKLATGLAGLVGVLMTIFIGYGTAKIVRRRSQKDS
ncbi:MAG: energy-coupling factor ABC transporter permease [Firmicutes bacterium]|nr:energy-coupling factor ABC transporter permease [Bacillota bacterium]